MKRVLMSLLGKGFCLLGLGGPHQETVDAARLDALRLVQENEGADFKPPPSLIVDGLLGEEGSAEIMNLDGFNYEKAEKMGLQAADELLEKMGNELARVDSMLQSHVSSRSSLILHKAGIPLDCDVPELTPVGCQKWLEVLGHSRLMLILFLGPGYGRLEFQPLDAEGVEPYEVDVGPGTLAIVRADGVSHRFFSTARSLAVSCFLLEDAAATWRRRFGVPLVTTPVCRDLMDWAKERWELARRQQSVSQDDALDLPPQWQRMAHQVYQVGPQVVVRGTSCKFPSSYSDAGFWCGMQAGCDLIEEVPYCRWDHLDFFDTDPESWKWAKTNCRHGSFIDGIELFDNKFFGISPVESRGMDPAQRHILETSYEALYFSGYNKKNLMRSLLGVYVGAAATEMNFMPATACSSGTGGASSITSNRISFCLGLQGPSFTVDAQGASALAAMGNADMSLRGYCGKPCYQICVANNLWIRLAVAHISGLDTRYPYATTHECPSNSMIWSLAARLSELRTVPRLSQLVVTVDVCDHECVGGAYFMITGTTWILLSAKGQLSQQGRCLSFDQSAEGFVKSEGVANLVLERDEDNGKDRGPPVGIIAATYSNHTGRDLVLQATRIAAIAPSSVDAVECFSHGLPLQDAVEAQVLRRALRGYADVEAPLSLTSGFTGSGMALECAGMMQILKVLVSQRYGAITPLQHLHQLNPEIEQPSRDDAVLFSSEELAIEGLSSYCGTTGKSIGGTMCHVVTLGTLRTPETQAPPEDVP
ncbi:ppsA [Symbiodinium natans]|uniref:PpsA protein n=1 Tax=Symbiodinium natans TaxID=878477 RepID=A0A812NCQ1_9DINO|nr:ppsA [Symbiodinium natans]